MIFSWVRSRSGWCILFLGMALSAHGWNKPTHMVIGDIAYRDLLARSPRKLARVVALLRQHPDARTRWAAMLNDPALSEIEKDRNLFMLAARWPDDIRGQNNPNDHPTWHYVNYVYDPARGIARTDSTLATGENILQAYAQNRQILRSDAPDSAKAIALCWLFHLAGDVHMPLHTAALISPQFPEGDRGGNLFRIKVSMSNPTQNLHALWDGMLLDSDTYQAADQLAGQLAQEYRRPGLFHWRKPDIGRWSRESFALARTLAYREGTLPAGTGKEGAVLPADYLPTAKPIAGRQVALSGHRLADELLTDVKIK